MDHERVSSMNGSTTTSNSIKVNKKKKKRKFFQISDNTMNSSPKQTSTTTENQDGAGKVHQPKKKRRNKKKAQENGSSESIKPVLVVKTPEDYSANWKKLQEIILEEEKQNTGSDATKEKTGDKFKRMRRKNRNQNQQKANEMNKTSDKAKEGESAPVEEELDIWFDNVDPILLEGRVVHKNRDTGNKKNVSKTLVKENSFDGVTKVVAMDCEMVGVGMDGQDSVVARVSIVNLYGKVLYDKFVKPTEEVTDYRTAVSGVRPHDLENGCDFSTVQKEVADLIEGRILVGHALHNDLRTLYLTHPGINIRDTAKYKSFKAQFGGRTPSLKKLVERFLGVQIQQGEHNSVQDAQAAMRLYTMHRREWEKSRSRKFKKSTKTAAAK